MHGSQRHNTVATGLFLSEWNKIDLLCASCVYADSLHSPMRRRIQYSRRLQSYLEIHQIHGTPYTTQDDILAEVKIETRNVSGYYTTVLPLTFKGDSTKLLCAYSESFFRVGSVVYVQPTAPVCCCMRTYTPDSRLGSFLCPRSAQGNGPFAGFYRTLSDKITRDSLILEYPYCHSDLDGPDRYVVLLFRSPERLLLSRCVVLA